MIRSDSAPNPFSRPRHGRVGRAPSLLVGAGALLGLATCATCGGSPSGAAETVEQPLTGVAFDADKAWAHLEKVVAFGPRYSGSKANERLRAYIVAELEALGLKPVEEAFRDDTPIGELGFTNLYADVTAPPVDGRPAPMIVIGSHFDTKRMSFHFVGASDGGSSTAVLLELARCLSGTPRRGVTYRFLFLDGEESIRPDWGGTDNTYGSRFHVKKLGTDGMIKRVKAFVLLDLVGDKDLTLTHETNSDPEMLEIFFDAARRNGMERHVRARAQPLSDDHLSFLAAGIRSVDLIDFEYGGPSNPHWHEKTDTLENCSAESLGVVGRIVLLGLPALERLVAQI